MFVVLWKHVHFSTYILSLFGSGHDKHFNRIKYYK